MHMLSCQPFIFYLVDVQEVGVPQKSHPRGYRVVRCTIRRNATPTTRTSP